MLDGAEIEEVVPGSLAQDLGLTKGDIIKNLNGRTIKDLIDFRLMAAEENIELEVAKSTGETFIFEIDKEPSEDLGVIFKSATFDGLRTCCNRCMFCFVDQMPTDLRPTLYVKDDDYRHSFLHGNFITLTNLTEKDIERIVALHLSPLYISVHTTDRDLRVKMLRNRKAGEIMDLLQKLADHGIEMHTQAVLCPGWNDGRQLEQTIMDLKGLWPQVGSLAVVPVGLTRYRVGLPRIGGYTTAEARSVLEIVDRYQQDSLESIGSRFVFAADEFFLKAGEPLPDVEDYEDFPQLENGVGLVQLFREEFHDSINSFTTGKVGNANKIAVVTGISAGPIIQELIMEAQGVYSRLDVKVVPINNNFFGRSVTVAGLLTGQDLLEGLIGQVKDRLVIIPEVMLRSGAKVFLDGTSLEELANKLNVPVKTVPVNGSEFLKSLLEKY